MVWYGCPAKCRLLVSAKSLDPDGSHLEAGFRLHYRATFIGVWRGSNGAPHLVLLLGFMKPSFDGTLCVGVLLRSS